MLDVSRIDADTVKVGTTPVSVKHIIDELVKGFRKSAIDRKVEFITEHAEGTPNINGDPSLIQKALYQLIINAIKYTPDGGKITVSTHPVVMEESEAPGVQIEVKDTGIGLDPEHHELVFEKFYQVGNVALHSSGKTTFKGGGPGLGLAIVRGVARAHGGKVWVESPGQDEEHFPGCTFYMQLPVEPPKRENGKT
jgi:signal transduction histidine kinase